MYQNKIFKSQAKKIPVVFLFFILFSCTSKFDELNTPQDQINLNQVDATLLGQVFAESQFEGMLSFGGTFQIGQNLFSDLYAQYFATSANYFDTDQYVETPSFSGGAWSRFYRIAAPQLRFVENYTKEHGPAVGNAIVKVWRVQVYHRMTDYWGPIIYSQFGNGQTSVAYDSQESIYMDFFKTLDEAVAVLKASTGEKYFTSSDLVYGGSAEKWLLFANSLRLRLAMRIAYVNPQLAQEEAEKAAADGVISLNSDNANVLTTAISRNPMDMITSWGEFRMSATIQSVLEGYDDPRLSEYFEEAVIGGGYKGIRNGLPRTEKNSLNDKFSNVDIKWQAIGFGGSNPPVRVMCASEVYFLLAEGALRGWNMGGTAKEFYEDGIRTSLKERTTVSDAQIDQYIASVNTPAAINDQWNTPAMSDIPVLFEDGGSFERKLEQIITQKWIAIYPDGWEAWAERRRTGYPKGYPLIESLNTEIQPNEMVRRLKFTSDEIVTNASAVETARTLLGGPDANGTHLWWDAK